METNTLKSNQVKCKIKKKNGNYITINKYKNSHIKKNGGIKLNQKTKNI